jgi:hypothetical protein
MTNPTCTIESCAKPARSMSASLCPMHYHRQYRHGSTEKVAHVNGVSVSLGRRYRQVPAKGHPVAHADGRAYEHRVVLYDLLGPGPHPCHWCGTGVDWLPKGTKGELQPDHLNDDGSDNRPDNLVPSCRTCNSTRAVQRRADALRAAGWWSGNDTIAHLTNGGRAARIEPAA